MDMWSRGPRYTAVFFLLRTFHPMIGSVFSNYQVIRKIGGGNTGLVYKVFDPVHHMFLALKILPDHFLISKETKARFMREVKAASMLSHDALARLYEVGEWDGVHYIAMEYVDGESYKQIIQASPEGVDVARFYQLMLPVLDGVAHAHDRNLVHRDLKPDNIKLTAEGYPKVLDFGLVKFLDKQQPAGPESFQTMAGMVLGSAGYMSPEQAEGEPFDERTDIFSLGIIMYELLSGKNPFQGKNPFDTIVKIINTEPLSLELLRPDLSMELCRVICKCLSKNMSQRYAGADTVYRAIAATKG